MQTIATVGLDVALHRWDVALRRQLKRLYVLVFFPLRPCLVGFGQRSRGRSAA
jgi:hypothetical protein